MGLRKLEMVVMVKKGRIDSKIEGKNPDAHANENGLHGKLLSGKGYWSFSLTNLLSTHALALEVIQIICHYGAHNLGKVNIVFLVSTAAVSAEQRHERTGYILSL